MSRNTIMIALAAVVLVVILFSVFNEGAGPVATPDVDVTEPTTEPTN